MINILNQIALFLLSHLLLRKNFMYMYKWLGHSWENFSSFPICCWCKKSTTLEVLNMKVQIPGIDNLPNFMQVMILQRASFYICCCLWQQATSPIVQCPSIGPLGSTVYQQLQIDYENIFKSLISYFPRQNNINQSLGASLLCLLLTVLCCHAILCFAFGEKSPIQSSSNWICKIHFQGWQTLCFGFSHASSVPFHAAPIQVRISVYCNCIQPQSITLYETENPKQCHSCSISQLWTEVFLQFA